MYDRFASCYVMIRCRVVTGSVWSIFLFIWPTETKIFGLQSSQLKPTEIVETQSVLVGFGFGRCSVFAPRVWASWAFGFFFFSKNFLFGLFLWPFYAFCN